MCAGHHRRGAERDPGLTDRLGREPGQPAGLGRLDDQFVQPGGEPLGKPAGVGERDGRPMCADQREDPLLGIRPVGRTAAPVLPTGRTRRWPPRA
ncbi:hypothetical protein AVL59_24445 [Streptomyces griseochromogenes]|uniref:Uncharacterized protein n=1 Tax=Streptomyces griseochromogenes TaxID=68214 RepID=A0A1B1B0D3_9ACTN|nr:hypothetical protein AVL59_24445 [Streptomyces griseochromogenes]